MVTPIPSWYTEHQEDIRANLGFRERFEKCYSKNHFYGTAPRLTLSQAAPNSYPNISMSCQNLSLAISRVSLL